MGSTLLSGGIRFSTGLPRQALALDLAVAQTREILLVGQADRSVTDGIKQLGGRLMQVARAGDAITLLAGSDFHAIVLDPGISGAMDFVKSLKLPDLPTVSEQLRAARRRHTWTPVFILPIGPEWEFGVIIQPPELAYLENRHHVPIHRAVMRLCVSRIINSLPPVA